MNRRAILASLAAGSLLGTRFALARGPEKAHRLGLLMPGCELDPANATPGSKAQAQRWIKEEEDLLKALAKLGHVVGRNLSVERRCFEVDATRGAQRAAELVRQGVDALWTLGTPQTRALQDATRTIPIIASVADPVASGFARTLARPGGNITGVAQSHPDVPAKQLELLRRIVPRLDRLVLLGDVHNASAGELLRPYEIAARAAGLVAEVKIVGPAEFEHTFSEMKRTGVRAAFLMFTGGRSEATTRLAIRNGVATMYHFHDLVESGGLMSFHMFHGDFTERTASVIDKTFRGIKPADIPWELPDRSYIAINLRTAKALGLTVPRDLLVLADRVIE